MNLLDAYVHEVLSPPRLNDRYKGEGLVWWEVDVTYKCWSDVAEKRTLTFETEEEALKVEKGFHFLT